MLLFQIVQLLDPQVAPEQCKVHLAVWNGKEDPLDVYIEGRFDEWQSWQTRRNFDRPLVVSLIAVPQDSSWLFAGARNSEGCEWFESHGMHRYRLSRRLGPNELDGRLIVRFKRPGRQSYLLGENWSQAIGPLNDLLLALWRGGNSRR